jgi:hypothetical protein
MALTVTGQSGGPTSLSAKDDGFGVMTQDPLTNKNHSPDGLTNASQNTAFNSPVTILTYFSVSNPSAASLADESASFTVPYKLRITRAKVKLLDNAGGRLGQGLNRCSVAITGIASLDISDLKQGEERDIELPGGTTLSELAEDATLEVKLHGLLGEAEASTDVLEMIVELTFIRVI